MLPDCRGGVCRDSRGGASWPRGPGRNAYAALGARAAAAGRSASMRFGGRLNTGVEVSEAARQIVGVLMLCQRQRRPDVGSLGDLPERIARHDRPAPGPWRLGPTAQLSGGGSMPGSSRRDRADPGLSSASPATGSPRHVPVRDRPTCVGSRSNWWPRPTMPTGKPSRTAPVRRGEPASEDANA